MTRSLLPLFAIAAAAALVACGDKSSSPAQTNVSPPMSSAPAAPAVSTPVVPAPAPPATGSNSAETAKDTVATNPKGAMSDAQQSNSMPMSGQAGSHSSTALDPKEASKK